MLAAIALMAEGSGVLPRLRFGAGEHTAHRAGPERSRENRLRADWLVMAHGDEANEG